MSKYSKRKKTQHKKRKQVKKDVNPLRRIGGQAALFVKSHSVASLAAVFCAILLVVLIVVIGMRKRAGNEAALTISDMSQLSGAPVTTDISQSRDDAVTYKDPSDTSTPAAPAPGNETQKTAGEGAAKIIDLTVLSSTMIYAEVYNIMSHPDEYMGKTVKMSGPYYASYYDITDLYYHYVVIEDATACCQQGLEFIWNGEHNYPDDYPEERTEIEVSGLFSSYDELGRTYYYIAVDDISILQ